MGRGYGVVGQWRKLETDEEQVVVYDRMEARWKAVQVTRPVRFIMKIYDDESIILR